MPKISIIVPIYNVKEYLDTCISSVISQSYRDFEVILIDDGSTDGSGKLCDKWEQLDKRIRVIHQDNGGASIARNTGINMAQGDFLIFLDSDDYWKSEKFLYYVASRLKITNADVLCFNYEKIDKGKKSRAYFYKTEDMPAYLVKKDSLKYQMEHGLWIACAWNKVIRRELFGNGQLYFRPGTRSEDIDWCVRLALCTESFDYINFIGVCYRQRETSISRTITIGSIKELLMNVEHCMNILDKSDDNEKKIALRPYVAYQYGTALVYISKVSKEKEYGTFLEWAEQNKYVLEWSQNYKIRLLRMLEKWKDIRFVINLLRLRERIKNGGKNE